MVHRIIDKTQIKRLFSLRQKLTTRDNWFISLWSNTVADVTHTQPTIQKRISRASRHVKESASRIKLEIQFLKWPLLLDMGTYLLFLRNIIINKSTSAFSHNEYSVNSAKYVLFKKFILRFNGNKKEVEPTKKTQTYIWDS